MYLLINKSALIESKSTHSDKRSYMLSLHYMCGIYFGLNNLYPRFWSLQDFLSDPKIGLKDEKGVIVRPRRMNLSSEKLDRTGIFIVENGLQILIWIGRQVNPDILGALFGQKNLDLIPTGKMPLPMLENDLSLRLNNFLRSIRLERLNQATICPQTYIIREDGDPKLRMMFLSKLIEDRVEMALSYPQFLATVRDEVQNSK